MKEKLLKLLKAKQEQRSALMASLVTSDTKEERSAINETVTALDNEIREIEQLIEDCDKPDDQTPAPAGNDPAKATDARGMDVLASIMQSRGQKKTEKVDPYDTEEYRTAFMNFVCRGVPIPAEVRGDAITKTTDASAVIPTTTLKEIISELKSYGNIYAQVRKLNVQGGVEIPILSLKPTATWITADTGTSESEKKKIQANTSISFSYYGLECKISQTLLVNVVTLEMFQQLFVPLASEAIVHALEIAIFNGSGSGQPTGILTDSRVPAANKITLSSTDIASWSEWKKQVFAKMKKSYRRGKFIMAQATFDGYIDGMVDANDQPIGRVNYGIDGAETYRFGGKEVETVENDIIEAYDDADTGDVIAVFVNLTDYAINTNLEMQTVKWIDHDTNEIKNKCILICDGKLVDPNGVLIIKKGA